MQSKTHRIFLVWSFWSPLEGCTSIKMLPSKGSDAALQTTATIPIEICDSAKYYIVNSQDAQIQRIGFIYLYRIKQFVKQDVGLLV